MNTLYYINKFVGVAFALGLAVFVGFRVVQWRDQASKDAAQRFQKRIQRISEDSAAQFPISAQTPILPDHWKNFDGPVFTPEALLGIGANSGTKPRGR